MSITNKQVAARYGVRDDADPTVEAVVAVGADQAPGSVLDVVLGHATVRDYLPEPLDDEVVTTLVAAAQSAASSSNMQLWSVVVVTDPARKARLAALAGDQKHVAAAPLVLVFVADLARARAAAGDLPATDLLDTTVVAVVDIGIAAQNAVLVAESLGLGACYIGAIRNDPQGVAAELGLPDGTFAVVGVTLGRPDPSRRSHVKPRLPQQAVVHHETYDMDAQSPAVAVYESRVAGFYAAMGMAGGWTARLTDRLGSPQSLNGRENLREALVERGLPSN
ncbi:MAG: nitroreductase family protein [Micrococcales bacterium]|nr:nitroreductase family protein [Micrococcales bacterium]